MGPFLLFLFTFSFPVRQKGLDKGELITWTKGFKCEGVEGSDVVALLKKSIEKRGDVKIDVAAILNDTTGCLMSCAWKNPKCRIGLIIGTGTNVRSDNIIGMLLFPLFNSFIQPGLLS